MQASQPAAPARPWSWVLGLAGLLAAHLAGPAGADDDVGATLRLRHDARSANHAGPIGAANALQPGVAETVRRAVVAEAELRGTLRVPDFAKPRVSLTGAAVVAAERRATAARSESRSSSRLNEGFAAADLGAWQASAGKKIVAWDIGHAFRPNDVVQQETRRTLLMLAQEGRPLIEVERYGAQSAGALVWVNPQHLGRTYDTQHDAQRGAAESAFAARGYVREGSADWHAFARWGRHTHGSLGAALAWVANDEWELHASARVLQRHDAWQIDVADATVPAQANPWRQVMQGRAAQALLGASWTGAQQISVLGEWWYDGTALADADWDAWHQRNVALVAFGSQSGLPQNLVAAAAGNLAWQATPFAASNLRRRNALVRLAWQPADWVVSLDATVTPRDRGTTITAAAQWQGERLRLNAAWRLHGGPGDALFAQLPQRKVGLLAASWPL
jgi:hypothetical protein